MFSSIEAFSSVSSKFKKSCHTDDAADRLSHRYTTLGLMSLAVIVTTATYVGDHKIKCWIPEDPEKDWRTAYINSYCWISNTYRVPMLETIPVEIDRRQDAEITYYQWVPLILMFQALLFFFPNFIWNILNVHSGINLKQFKKLSDDTLCKGRKDYEEAIENIAKTLHKWIGIYKPYKRNKTQVDEAKSKLARVFCLYCNKREGTYLTGLFLFTKVLYVANAIIQFYILNAFMGPGFSLYGYEYIRSLHAGTLMKESPRFPRITLCDYEIRQLQNVQRWTVQCVLPYNLFNEMIFLVLWFWFIIIAVVSCISFIKWTFKLMFRRHAYSYVKKYLILKNPDRAFTSSDKMLIRKFAERYLRNDGCYVIWMIGYNSTEIVVMDLIEKMWTDYKDSLEQNPKKQPLTNSHVTR